MVCDVSTDTRVKIDLARCSPYTWMRSSTHAAVLLLSGVISNTHTHTGQRLTVPDIPSAHQVCVCLDRDGREMYSSWSLWAKAKTLKRNPTCHRKCKHLALRAIWSSFQLRLGIRPLAASFSFPLNLSHFLHAQFSCFLLSSYVSVDCICAYLRELSQCPDSLRVL